MKIFNFLQGLEGFGNLRFAEIKSCPWSPQSGDSTQSLKKNKVAALLDYAPKAWFGMNAKYFKLKYSGAFDDKNA